MVIAAIGAIGLLSTMWLLWTRGHSKLNLPSYNLTKKQYYDIMMDPTAFQSFLPSAGNEMQTYPAYFPLIDLLSPWPASNVAAKSWTRSAAHPSKGKSLYRLNYMMSQERELAQSLRDKELPFVLYNVPDLDRAAETGFSLENILNSFESVENIVERSSTNEFMYFLVR